MEEKKVAYSNAILIALVALIIYVANRTTIDQIGNRVGVLLVISLFLYGFMVIRNFPSQINNISTDSGDSIFPILATLQVVFLINHIFMLRPPGFIPYETIPHDTVLRLIYIFGLTLMVLLNVIGMKVVVRLPKPRYVPHTTIASFLILLSVVVYILAYASQYETIEHYYQSAVISVLSFLAGNYFLLSQMIDSRLDG